MNPWPFKIFFKKKFSVQKVGKHFTLCLSWTFIKHINPLNGPRNPTAKKLLKREFPQTSPIFPCLRPLCPPKELFLWETLSWSVCLSTGSGCWKRKSFCPSLLTLCEPSSGGTAVGSGVANRSIRKGPGLADWDALSAWAKDNQEATWWSNRRIHLGRWASVFSVPLISFVGLGSYFTFQSSICKWLPSAGKERDLLGKSLRVWLCCRDCSNYRSPLFQSSGGDGTWKQIHIRKWGPALPLPWASLLDLQFRELKGRNLLSGLRTMRGQAPAERQGQWTCTQVQKSSSEPWFCLYCTWDLAHIIHTSSSWPQFPNVSLEMAKIE